VGVEEEGIDREGLAKIKYIGGAKNEW